MPKKYNIKPLLWLVRDEKGTRFHVNCDDYFGTIATILSLLKQQIKKEGSLSSLTNKTLKNLEKDLLFLQTNYNIKPRPQSKPNTKNKNKAPNGKLINQWSKTIKTRSAKKIAGT